MNEVITPDVIKAAEYVGESWRKGVESIIETGQRLLEIKEQFKDEQGKWSALLGRGGNEPLLPFAKSQAYNLMKVANDERIVRHVGQMPPDSNALGKLAALSDDRFYDLLEKGGIHPGMKRNEASAETRTERKEDDEARIMNLQPVEGKFKTIIIDPPWDYEWLSLAGRAAPGYATMTHEELMALDVDQWADDNCHIYIWVTNNFMARGCELMTQWGFQHKTVLTWVKPRMGLGSYFRNTTEHVLFGVKGELRTRSDSIVTHFEGPMGEHSAKPQEFYDLVETASYPPYGECFQRENRSAFKNLYEENK